MAERIKHTPEIEHSPGELKRLGAERQEELREQKERGGEKSRESLDEARQEALERARSIEVEKQPSEEHEQQPSPEHQTSTSRQLEGEANFNATMTEVRSQMSAPSRTFSKIIHNRVVEKVSDVAGSTIARPNALLSGAIFAFALTLGVYLVAKNLGYPLSGFESIGAFIAGWVIGIVYDFLKVMVTGRQ